MSFTISQFKAALGEGARPNLFTVTFTSPNAGIGLGNSNLLCKAAALPGFTVGVIEVPMQGGRRVKLPGDRTFAEWTATFIADEGHVVRKGFEDWMASIVNPNFESTTKGNFPSGAAVANNYNYKQNITVAQLGQDGKPIQTYLLKEAFPTDVSQLDLSYDTTDAIAEFTVTFQYSYFT